MPEEAHTFLCEEIWGANGAANAAANGIFWTSILFWGIIHGEVVEAVENWKCKKKEANGLLWVWVLCFFVAMVKELFTWIINYLNFQLFKTSKM